MSLEVKNHPILEKRWVLHRDYLATLPEPPPNISLISYTDDCTVFSSGVNNNEVCTDITCYFFRNRYLRMSAPKSSVFLFTTCTKEVKKILNMKVEGQRIPTVRYPKILVVTFDNLLYFAAHATNIDAKVRMRKKILKELAVTTWGMDEETIVTTYKASGRSLLNSAAPIWISFLSATQWRALQTSQKMTSIDHPHE